MQNLHSAYRPIIYEERSFYKIKMYNNKYIQNYTDYKRRKLKKIKVKIYFGDKRPILKYLLLIYIYILVYIFLKSSNNNLNIIIFIGPQREMLFDYLIF